MVDLVAVDRRDQGLVVGLVRELRRVDADDDEHVGVALLDLAQLVDDVQAVDAAERPEVEQHDAPAQPGQRQRLRGVDPAAGAVELGGPDPRGSQASASNHPPRIAGMAVPVA